MLEEQQRVYVFAKESIFFLNQAPAAIHAPIRSSFNAAIHALIWGVADSSKAQNND